MDEITIDTRKGETTTVGVSEKIAKLTNTKEGETVTVRCLDRASIVKTDLSGTTRTKPGKGHK